MAILRTSPFGRDSTDGRRPKMAAFIGLGAVALMFLAGCDGPARPGGAETAESYAEQIERLESADVAADAETAESCAEQIERLESADVAADVEAALVRGDKRFVGVMGVGLIVPGVDTYAHRGVRVIENTSDAIESDEHLRLQEAARRYAEHYNKLLLKRISP